MTDTAPLRLFWYRREPNFGDAISPLIVAGLARREVVWAGHDRAELYAVGSLMRMIAVHHKEARAKASAPPVVWGSGLMGPPPNLSFLDHVDVALLRGPVTASLLHRHDRAFGDPGLLADRLLDKTPARQDKIGVVPHMHSVDDPALHAILARDPRLVLIDVRAADPLFVVAQIATCAHVISQSLHGLIVADAFGIPNTWLDPTKVPGAGALKFLDYAASVERVLGLPIGVDDIPEIAKSAPTGALPYAQGVDVAKAALVAHFPSHLVQPAPAKVAT